ncbi:MAG: ABC transporter substrate-binding protein, partial [Alphaproteobacteria bacterium]
PTMPIGPVPTLSTVLCNHGLSATRSAHRAIFALLAFALLAAAPGPAKAVGADGQLTWGVHISLAPTWFDPAEMSGIITPYMVYYALHDALVKPMPGKPFAPSLAESWTISDDGLLYEFTLRKGITFHNGEAVTSEDVKFSYERYRGSSSKPLKDHVAAVETPDPLHVRFKLKAPWPDFLTFYTTATGAAWVVPKKYVEQVGDEGFKKAPVGAGPYKFVSFTPGLELTMEAFDQYWRKKPSVHRLMFKVIPDESTRLAALKRGEIDIAYSIRGELAEEVVRTEGLTLKPTVIQAPFWLYFPDQWDPKSPWHDQRVRQAASLAIDRKTINQALALGHSKITGSIIPQTFEYYWQPPAPQYDPAKAKQLLAEAGFAKGFDAGEYYCDGSYSNVAEAVINDLQAVGIHVKLRPLERAAFFKSYSEKSFKNIIQGASGAFGNTATRLQAFVVKGGTYVYGNYPDLDALFDQQAAELDLKKRAALLEKLQQMVHERTIYAHIWQLAFINAAGPRVGESGLGLIAGHAYSAPYEDVTLAGK